MDYGELRVENWVSKSEAIDYRKEKSVFGF